MQDIESKNLYEEMSHNQSTKSKSKLFTNGLVFVVLSALVLVAFFSSDISKNLMLKGTNFQAVPNTSDKSPRGMVNVPFKSTFTTPDSNNDGIVTAPEFKDFIKANKNIFPMKFEEADLDKDGKVSVSEFHIYLSEKSSSATSASLSKAAAMDLHKIAETTLSMIEKSGVKSK